MATFICIHLNIVLSSLQTHSHHSSGSSEIATPAFYIASTPAAHQAGAHTSPFAPVQVINYGENSTPRAGFSRGGLALGRLINGGARAGDEVERDSLLKPNGRGKTQRYQELCVCLCSLYDSGYLIYL